MNFYGEAAPSSPSLFKCFSTTPGLLLFALFPPFRYIHQRTSLHLYIDRSTKAAPKAHLHPTLMVIYDFPLTQMVVLELYISN